MPKLKYLIIIPGILFFIIFSGTAYVNATVVDGRNALFNNTGNPTYNDILLANQEFKAAAGDASDQEANFFYAITRLLAFILENRENGTMDTFQEVAEAIGLPLTNLNKRAGQDAPYGEPPEIYDQYDPPLSLPTGEGMRTFLLGPLQAELDGALNNLAIIDSSFSITLTQAETGDIADLEIDYGDILLARAFLYSIKSAILLIGSYVQDFDIRELAATLNAGVFQLQRDLLDKYNSLFTLKDDGAASLNSSKLALLNGINAAQAAFDFITNESDPQIDDLFYFGTQEDINDAEDELTRLATIKNSIDLNTPVTIIFEDQRGQWTLINETGEQQLTLEVVTDVHKNFVMGWYYSVGNCTDFLNCNGNVENFVIDGTSVYFSAQSYNWCTDQSFYISYDFEGTLDPDTDTINGTYNETNCSGNRSAPFSATLQESLNQGVVTVDANYLFGNTGKSPLDIRANLPTFDSDGDILAGSFTEPVLGSLLPGIVTEQDLKNELGLELVYDIPILTPTLDGFASDWAAVLPIMVDDIDQYQPPLNGDIKSVSVGRDNDFYYWMMVLNDPPTGRDLNYETMFWHNYPGDGLMNRVFLDSLGSNHAYLINSSGMDLLQPGLPPQDYPSLAALNSVVEAKIPIIPGMGTKVFMQPMTEWGWDTIDPAVQLRLLSANLTGTLSCPSWSEGKIYIWARSGPDFQSSELIGSAILDGPGEFEISGLPLGINVYLFAMWDADGNGIKTFGDYFSSTGPVMTSGPMNSGNLQQLETNVSEVDITVDTLVDDSFVMTKPGLFRIFGSNSFVPNSLWEYYQPPHDVQWDMSEWTFLGEGQGPLTLETDQFYKHILIIWHSNTNFNIDSFEDVTAGTAFATNQDGSVNAYEYWVTYGLRNFDVPAWETWSDPTYFRGVSDLIYAKTDNNYGLSIFPMPDDNFGEANGRQLKISLVSNSPGDLNNDFNTNLTDAINGLQVMTGLKPQLMVVPDISDINRDGKIGIAEVNFILQYLMDQRINN